MSKTLSQCSRDKLIWWLRPVPVFVGLNGITGLAALLAGPETYLSLWKTPKYFNASTALITASVLVSFCAGVWLSSLSQSGELSGDWPKAVSFSRFYLLFNVSFWICLSAYVIWILLGISRGLSLALLKSIFLEGTLEVYTLRDSLKTVPGVTTCTQVGIATVILGCLIGASGRWRLVRGKLAILVSLALVRAVLYSERLAFLELAVPFLVLWVSESADWRRSPMRRWTARMAPLLGAAVVYVVFTLFETVRSWAIYYSSRESSLALFGFWRLVGYYVTSANNTAYLISRFPRSLGAPYFTLNLLWEFPVSQQIVSAIFSWTHLDYDSYMALLARGANPEFNNFGGLLSPVVDFGILGGLAYWLAMGWITGCIYHLYVRKHPLGMLLYPVIFLTLTEIPRYIYWGEGRAFPALVYLFLSAAVLLRSAQSEEPRTSLHTHPIQNEGQPAIAVLD